METTGAETYAVLIPSENLDPRSRFIGENKGGAFMPSRLKDVLHVLRQGVDPPDAYRRV